VRTRVIHSIILGLRDGRFGQGTPYRATEIAIRTRDQPKLKASMTENYLIYENWHATVLASSGSETDSAE